jgi:hypothetical protein
LPEFIPDEFPWPCELLAMAELPPVMEAAARMLELPMGEEEAGIVEGFVLKMEEPGRGVLPTGENEEFWLVELAAMEAMTEAKVGMETTSPNRPRGCPEGQDEQAQGHDAHALQDDLPHAWSPPSSLRKVKTGVNPITHFLPSASPCVKGKLSTFRHSIARP